MNIFIYFALCFALQGVCVTHLFCPPPQRTSFKPSGDHVSNSPFASAPANGLQRSKTMSGGYAGSYGAAGRPRAVRNVPQHQDGFNSSFAGNSLLEKEVVKPAQTNQVAPDSSQETNALLQQLIQEQCLTNKFLEETNRLLKQLVASNGQLPPPAAPLQVPGFVPNPPPLPPQNGSVGPKLATTQSVQLEKPKDTDAEDAGGKKPPARTGSTGSGVSGAVVGGSSIMGEIQKNAIFQRCKQDSSEAQNTEQPGNDEQKVGPDSSERSPANVAEVLLGAINGQDEQTTEEKRGDSVGDLTWSLKKIRGASRISAAFSTGSTDNDSGEEGEDKSSDLNPHQPVSPASTGGVQNSKPPVPARPEGIGRKM